MKRMIKILALGGFFSAQGVFATPSYPPVCHEMAEIALEIAKINDALREQMHHLTDMESKQFQDWAQLTPNERENVQQFCVDTKEKLSHLKAAIVGMFQQVGRLDKGVFAH